MLSHRRFPQKLQNSAKCVTKLKVVTHYGAKILRIRGFWVAHRAPLIKYNLVEKSIRLFHLNTAI